MIDYYYNPIFVWGGGGKCCSILIWIIKKIINPDYAVENPIDELFTAHNQPLNPHWFGKIPLDDFLKKNHLEKIYHCEPLYATWGKTLNYKNIVVTATTDEEMKQVAIFKKYKIKEFQDQDLKNFYLKIKNDYYVSKQLDGALNLSVSDIFTEDIMRTIEQLTNYLNLPQQEYQKIIDIHKIWYNANYQLIISHMKELS